MTSLSPTSSPTLPRVSIATDRVLAFEPTRGRVGRPHLQCGIPPAINASVDRAHRHSLEWAVELGLVDSAGRKFDHLSGARFAWLAARAYPQVDGDALELIADWITFLFFYDDMCDTQESTEAGYLDQLMAAEDRLIAIGHGAPAREDDTPLDRALVDIRARAKASAGERWLGRLGAHIQEYVEGVRWERLIRAQRSIPSATTYSKLRLVISAVFPCFDFAGMFIDGQRADFVDDPLVSRLEVMANNYICWVNDIYGIDKELGEDTTSNIVIVLANECGSSWDQALDRAIELCNAELAAFNAHARELEAKRKDSRARLYVAALEAWMRGNLDWYSETERYQIDDGESRAACWSSWTEWRSVA